MGGLTITSMYADPTLMFRIVDLGGVLANGMLGGALARRLGFDPVGFITLGVLSGLGGGLLRDTLLQVPAVALHDIAYLSTALVGAAIAFLINVDGKWSNRVLTVGDALALGCWAATGVSKALTVADLPMAAAILIGVITAVGGGMIRDIVVARVPVVFTGTLYASVALICCTEMAILVRIGQPQLGMAVAIITAGVITLVARRRGWVLPNPTHLPALFPRRATPERRRADPRSERRATRGPRSRSRPRRRPR